MNKKGEGWSLPSLIGLVGLFFLVTAILHTHSWKDGIAGVGFLIVAIAIYLKK